MESNEKIRIQKIIAEAGIASQAVATIESIYDTSLGLGACGREAGSCSGCPGNPNL